MQVRWTREALDKLLLIDDFIAKENPKRSKNFVNLLLEKDDSLAESPYRGRKVPEFNNSQIREIIVKNFRLVYKISADIIYIITVFEGHKILKLNNLD